MSSVSESLVLKAPCSILRAAIELACFGKISSLPLSPF